MKVPPTPPNLLSFLNTMLTTSLPHPLPMWFFLPGPLVSAQAVEIELQWEREGLWREIQAPQRLHVQTPCPQHNSHTCWRLCPTSEAAGSILETLKGWQSSCHNCWDPTGVPSGPPHIPQATPLPHPPHRASHFLPLISRVGANDSEEREP